MPDLQTILENPLTLWNMLLENKIVEIATLIVYAWTLHVLNGTLKEQKKTTTLQSKSVEQTARMEQGKVLMDAFSQNEMYEAIAYFLKHSPYVYLPNGEKNTRFIAEVNANPDTRKHRYRLMTALHHAERLYQTEKADTALFTSLISPAIVEVTLHVLPALDDYTNDVDKDVYQMVYKVFEKIRRSYLHPLYEMLKTGRSIPAEAEQTRSILKSLKKWDEHYNHTLEAFETESRIVLTYLLEKKDKDVIQEANTLLTKIKHYETNTTQKTKQNTKHIINLKYALYTYLGLAKLSQRNYEGAIEDFNEAITLNSKDADAYYNRGVAKLNRRDFEGAIEDFKKTLEINPQCTVAREALNNQFRERQNLNEKNGTKADFEMAERLRCEAPDN